MVTTATSVVLRGKRTSRGAWLYVGAMLVLAGLVHLAQSGGDAMALVTAAGCLAIGIALVSHPLRLILQTVHVYADRVEWRRFPREVVMPYEAIARVAQTTHSSSFETFDKVCISMRDGSVHIISHLSDGNDLVRAINTYGVRRV